MLPNSRIIPPNTEQTNARRRSNSVLNDKKGLISRLLTKEQPSLQRSIHDYIPDNQREDHAYRSSFEHTKSISSSTKTNATGFGKLFKKRGKMLDDDLVLNTEEDQPHIRPIQHQQGKSHNKIPLAPPPEYPKAKTISQPDQHQFLTNLPVHYLTKRPTHDPPPIQLPPIPTPTLPSSPVDIGPTPLEADSTSSLRKSSGSYSIYSTFGGDESIYSVGGSADSLEQPRYSAQSVGGESVNSFTTVTSQQQHHHSSEEIDDTDSATTTITTISSDDDDEDDFVDATGFSQEDIEREQRMLEENINGSLTKRLSGGHYGSAGGLVASIQKNENRLSKSPPGSPVPALPIPPVPPIPEQHQPHHRRKSRRSTDDDLAKSMLNWKRQSGSSKRWSARSSVHKTVFSKDEKRASTITVIDLRSEPEELSVIDKMALRKQAEDALSGAQNKTAISTSSLPLASLDSVSRVNSLQFTTDFSKTLDDVWKTSEDNLHLLNDPRSKTLETNIKVHVVPEQESPVEELEKAKQTACLLWNEDESIVAREKMAEWLGKGKPFQTAVLYEYMQLFVFHEMRLDSAFRKLCSKLYFKAEAQQIDRILECFANRYWECNPDNLFGSADTVYAVVYSLLLLNTDLHVAQGNHARMTRSEFIRNTMSTIREQRDEHNSPEYRNWEAEVEFSLKEMYTSVKHYQILQPLGKDSHLTKRGSILRGRRVIGIKRSVHSIIRKSARESMLITETQDQDTIVVSPTTSSPSLGPPPRNSMSSSHHRSTTPSSSIKSPRRDSYSSTNSSVASLGSPHSPQPTVQYINTHATSLFSSRPPYFKEGIVVRKHLLETANQKAKHREWKECFVEVGHTGELRMYALQDGSESHHPNRGLFRHSTTIQDLKHNNKWASSAQLIGKVALNHTLSNPLPPPGYNRQRPHVFALQQSDGGVYLFQVASAEQAQEWVMTCNYWAARESKQNVDTGVGNMEYGWGDCLGDVVMDLDAMRQGYDQALHLHSALQDPDSIMIQDWIPPTPTMVSSQLEEEKQFESLQHHLVYLNNEINHHRDIKSKIFIKFPVKCHNYNRVLSNWETRSKYLLHDIIKYQNYCDALEKSLQTRQELKREKEEKKLVQETLYDSILPNSKLEYQSSAVDLFKEINQELHFV